MDCGPTCLRMVAAFYGKNFDPAKMKHISKISRKGSSMLDLMNAAEALGLCPSGLEVSASALKATPLPAILHWDQQHFVVLYKVENETYHIADPGIGILKLCTAAFLSHWQNPGHSNPHTGVILTFSVTPSSRIYG